MNQTVIRLLSIIFILSACGQSEPVRQLDQPATTSSPLPTATPTRTALPSATLTASITPLPTIPTFTPTFDVSTIVTVTPAPKVECLMEGTVPQVKFASELPGPQYVDHSNIFDILGFLNSGGRMEQLNAELSKTNSLYAIKDMTNDGIPDLVVVSGLAFQSINILWCQNGKYAVFPKDITEGETLGSDIVVFELHDLNQNSIPEILSIGSGRAWLNVNLLEWNGITFVDLTSSSTQLNASMTGAGSDDLELADPDKNGISEMVIKGLPLWWYYPGEPLRSQIDTYSWNGKTLSSSTRFDFPQYRFQAVQDGDIESLDGRHSKALALYTTAIESHELDWWSQIRFEINRTAAISGTPSPNPTPDNTEYPRLAAYAYYRIILIHLVQGHESDATTAYNTLQEKFGNDAYGHPYVEMATTFWEAYQSTHKMYDGCAAAIQYAVGHPDILTPLGSDYHGSQSHQYKPEDVCPFR